MLDGGSLTPDEFRAAMRIHAEEIIVEMEEDHQNPLAAYLEQILSRRAANKLVRRHGESLVREILLALAEVADFPPARWFWNAAHPHVPLHCFLRTRRDPVFRIVQIEAFPQVINMLVEHGSAAKETIQRERFRLRRDRRGQLFLEERKLER